MDDSGNFNAGMHKCNTLRLPDRCTKEFGGWDNSLTMFNYIFANIFEFFSHFVFFFTKLTRNAKIDFNNNNKDVN